MTENSPDPYRFCPLCASALHTFQDHERTRKKCPACGWIHYRNPTVGVALVIIESNQILLGQRSDGTWCIPCGHVEWDEDIRTAATREGLEELGVEPSIGEIYAVQSNFHDLNQQTVGVWFLSEIEDVEDLRAGGDLHAIDFFDLDDLPPLAFPTDQQVLSKIKQER